MSNKDDLLVEVKGVSKKFSRSLKRSMWYGLKDMGNAFLGANGNRSALREGEFWAVKDISFSLRRGECIGLIGRNGAGKSTLLKMLNGLIRPDEGSITMRGKVGALIELGAGFNPLLTGRENIYVNGQLLGFSKKEINKKLDDILDFAEIGEFIDSPVQNYSSGMKVRLGFAVAAQMEPDVLIIDEVLAVGDLGFVLKCFNTMDKIMQNTAVIFVSHSMPQISRICSDLMFLENGKSIFQDTDISKGIDLYYSKFATNENKKIVFDDDQNAILQDIHFGNEKGATEEGVHKLNRLEDLIVNIKVRVKSEFQYPFINIGIYDKEQRPIGICQNEIGLNETNIFAIESGYTCYSVQLRIPRINLSKGLYSISLLISQSFRRNPLLRLQSVSVFQVISKNDNWTPIEFEGIWT